MKNKKDKNNLDENQSRKLKEIEARGCWIAFWGLLGAMVIETIKGSFTMKELGGEWVVFTLLSVYIFVACLKNGIWNRKLKPNYRTNIILSMIAACTIGLLVFVVAFRATKKTNECLAAGISFFIITFVFTFGALTFSAAAYRRKVKREETEEALKLDSKEEKKEAIEEKSSEESLEEAKEQVLSDKENTQISENNFYEEKEENKDKENTL